ncbi:glycoside hydrolase family 3 protein [Nesterenkonia muleiensis]|uniref:glycoside hydrolase family 3 protein n=1 Tax=Nesterenkonia muleiensis TaxID=2282648 RepID=UPI001EE3B680|nr:glycoside hydrolase family 3 N-terminal domain-containing protein [Nesterenkonia muleiensis]
MSRFPRLLIAAALTGIVMVTSCTGNDGAGAPGTDAPGSESTEPTEEEIAEQERAQREQDVRDAIDEQEDALAGPGDQHRDQAAELVADMTLSQRAGQVLIGEYSGTDADSAAGMIEELHLAGVILMGHNIPGGSDSVNTEALAEQIETVSAAGSADDEEETGRAVPPIVSVDQEGGLVTRVGAPLTEWPTPMAHGAVHESGAGQHSGGGLWSAGQAHRHMGEDLADLGFTMAFAPNADVTIGAADPTIGSRSFGAEPDSVSALALQGLRGLAVAGVAGSAKHFPGHGSVTDDSHDTLPVQPQSLSELRDRDWLPFAEVIEAGAPMVMMGHIEVPALEDGVPSSLSEAAYAELREMGHDGVIVTDAMNMAAIAHRFGGDQAVVEALSAGADLILMPHSAPSAHSAIIAAVETGELEESRLEEAAERVVALVLWQQDLAAGLLAAGPGVPVPEDLAERMNYGPADSEYDGALWEGTGDSGDSGLTDVDAATVAEQVAAASITVVEGQCQTELIDGSLQIQGGTQQDRDRLAAAAQEAGLQVGNGPVVTLLGGSTPGSGDVVVSLDRPEALADSAADAKIALYGRSPEQFEALIEVLTGAEASGALPVEVGSYPVGHSAC